MAETDGLHLFKFGSNHFTQLPEVSFYSFKSTPRVLQALIPRICSSRTSSLMAQAGNAESERQHGRGPLDGTDEPPTLQGHWAVYSLKAEQTGALSASLDVSNMDSLLWPAKFEAQQRDAVITIRWMLRSL